MYGRILPETQQPCSVHFMLMLHSLFLNVCINDARLSPSKTTESLSSFFSLVYFIKFNFYSALSNFTNRSEPSKPPIHCLNSFDVIRCSAFFLMVKFLWVMFLFGLFLAFFISLKWLNKDSCKWICLCSQTYSGQIEQNDSAIHPPQRWGGWWGGVCEWWPVCSVLFVQHQTTVASWCFIVRLRPSENTEKIQTIWCPLWASTLVTAGKKTPF